MGFIIDPYRYAAGYDYGNGTYDMYYSLRKLIDWSNAVLKIRRTSDNATAYVFFDGAVAYNTITLNSYISTSSNTTPSTTTLTTWVSTDDGYVEEWYSQNPADTIADYVNTTTTTLQPQFISGGAIITASSNSLPTIDFLSSTRRLTGTGSASLADAADSTITSVSGNSATAQIGSIICNSNTSSNRFVMFNDTRTTGGAYRVGLIQTADGTFTCDLLSANGSTDQRALTAIHDGTNKELTGYLDGVYQDAVTWTNSTTNNLVRIGVQQSDLTPLSGNIQEVLIFNDIISGSDLTTLHNDIINYYGI